MSSMQIPRDLELTSACYAKQSVTGAHTLSELPLCGKLNIRGDSAQADIVNAFAQALSITPPVIANTKAANNGIVVYWTGPDEWMLHCPPEQTATLAKKIQQHLGALHHAVTDVSDYYTVLRLSGPQADAVLRRGCPQDLHLSVFPAGTITQTKFGHASIMLDRHQDEINWDIQVRWTYAEYVWEFIESAIAAL